MSAPQTLYTAYVNEYGYVPKQPNHLIAYAKQSGVKLKFSEARQIMKQNATNSPINTNKKAFNVPLSKPNVIKSQFTPKQTNKMQSNTNKLIKSKLPKSSTKIKKSPPKQFKSENITKRKWPPVQTSIYKKPESHKPFKSETIASKTANKSIQKKWPTVLISKKSSSKPATNNENINYNENNTNIPKYKSNINSIKPPPPPKNMKVNTTVSSNKKPAPPKPKLSNSENITPPKPPPNIFKNATQITKPPPPPKHILTDEYKSAPKPILSNEKSIVKLPHPPPRIITKKNATKSHFEEQKTSFISSKETAQPFMCRINYECKTEKCKQEIYDALTLITKLQLESDNPGLITYHCTTPNPIKYPLKLECIELYYNENAYINMTQCKSTQFDTAYTKVFGGNKINKSNKNIKSQSVVIVGHNVSDKIKKIMVNKFKSTLTFAETDAGYLFHTNYLKSLDYCDDTKLLFKLHLISPKYQEGNTRNIELILDIMDRLSIYAKESYALLFHCHRVNIKSYPHYLELISIWPNIECLSEFLQNNKVQMLMMQFKQLMIQQTDKMNRRNHFLCELYSEIEIANNIIAMIQIVFDEIGYTQQLKTDIGYILNPKANSSKLN